MFCSLSSKGVRVVGVAAKVFVGGSQSQVPPSPYTEIATRSVGHATHNLRPFSVCLRLQAHLALTVDG